MDGTDFVSAFFEAQGPAYRRCVLRGSFPNYQMGGVFGRKNRKARNSAVEMLRKHEKKRNRLWDIGRPAHPAGNPRMILL